MPFLGTQNIDAFIKAIKKYNKVLAFFLNIISIRSRAKVNAIQKCYHINMV